MVFDLPRWNSRAQVATPRSLGRGSLLLDLPPIERTASLPQGSVARGRMAPLTSDRRRGGAEYQRGSWIGTQEERELIPHLSILSPTVNRRI